MMMASIWRLPLVKISFDGILAFVDEKKMNNIKWRLKRGIRFNKLLKWANVRFLNIRTFVIAAI